MADEPQKNGPDIVNTDIFEPTDEEIKDNQRFGELKGKGDEELDEDEKSELKELKDRHSQRTRGRFDKMTSQVKASEYERGQAVSEAEQLRKENEELRTRDVKPPEPTVFKKESVQIGDKSYFTNETLQAMVDSKEITSDRANQHAEERNTEVASDKAYKRLKGEQEKDSVETTRRTEISGLMKEHPEFDNRHQNHNASDPLFVEFTALLNDGYKSIPKALEKAKKIVGYTDKKPDLSEQFNVGSPSAAAPESNKTQLSEGEVEIALNMFWERGDQINPNTNKPYTKQEAIEKALKAKRTRTKELAETRR